MPWYQQGRDRLSAERQGAYRVFARAMGADPREGEGGGRYRTRLAPLRYSSKTLSPLFGFIGLVNWAWFGEL